MKYSNKNIDLLVIIFDLIKMIKDEADVIIKLNAKDQILILEYVNGTTSEHDTYDSAIDFLSGMYNMLKISQED